MDGIHTQVFSCTIKVINSAAIDTLTDDKIYTGKKKLLVKCKFFSVIRIEWNSFDNTGHNIIGF